MLLSIRMKASLLRTLPKSSLSLVSTTGTTQTAYCIGRGDSLHHSDRRARRE